MSLSDLASLGSFVSGVAVLVSLVYLALQVRQADKNQRALLQQARASRASDHLDRLAEKETHSVYFRVSRGDEPVTAEDIGRYALLTRASLYGFEDAYFHHEQKLLDDAAFQSTVASLRGLFTSPAARVMWSRQRTWHEPGFQSFVDRIAAEAAGTNLSTPEEFVASWQRDVAAEMAKSRP